MTIDRIATVAALLVSVLLVASPAVADDWSDTDVFVDAHGTASLIDEGAAVVDARERSDYQSGHLPGATHLHWQQFVDGSATGELTDDDHRLEQLIEGAGVSGDEPVIVYGAWGDDGWGEEGRIFWTLEYLGHQQVHLLVGGIDAWTRSGRSLAASSVTTEPGEFTVERREGLRISTDQLLRRLNDDSDIGLLDTRESEEYDGVVKYGEHRGGHIPGAEHLWWEELVDDNGLIAPEQLETKLDERGIDTGDTVIAYCTGGVRSGFVYAVLRAAGFEDVRNYDASMWEWTRNGYPVATR